MNSWSALGCVFLCSVILLSLKLYSSMTVTLIDKYPIHSFFEGSERAPMVPKSDPSQLVEKVSGIQEAKSGNTTDMFSVIIVTFNEPLLEKTVLNVLENTRPGYVGEVLIIDDHSDVPVEWDPKETRVRIIRNNKRMGLIGARYIGGNNAKCDYLAFIDAHVFVGPDWLKTPRRLLMEDPRTVVNYINFNLDAKTYTPKSRWSGVGSSATILMDLRQVWGGGSPDDLFSPITMGMFVISKFWWNHGAMDPELRTWGGENVEISFRTWLCGGRIVVAKDSFVAHGFRTKFPYPVNGGDVQRNYVRIANVWMDKEHLDMFYNASRIKLHNGKPNIDFGDISARLRLKEELKCQPFSYYATKFKGRALCLPKHMRPSTGYSCGNLMAVNPSAFSALTHEQMFFLNATSWLCLLDNKKPY